MYNSTFKRPTGPPPSHRRSPSPPHAFIERFSPPPPSPIEPSFNYPAINGASYNTSYHTQYPPAATPKARSASVSKHHGRTPSTIDALAEAALAVSPTYSSHSRKSSVANGYGNSGTINGYGHNHAHPAFSPPYRSGEPPHKRARSELLPSPHVAQYASRPATSYEHANSRSNGLLPETITEELEPAYDSRVEEAALLLNFRTGGLPSTSHSTVPPPSAFNAGRPHSRSFPEVAVRNDTAGAASGVASQQPSLLPAFVPPQEPKERDTTLPSPQATSDSVNGSPKAHAGDVSVDKDVHMPDAKETALPQTPAEGSTPQQTQTPSDEEVTPAPSTDQALSESVSEHKGRRGWPKGKPRGPKPSTSKGKPKAAGARKKMSTFDGVKPGKSAKAHTTVPDEIFAELTSRRRKSFSDYLIPPVGSGTTRRASSVPRDIRMLIRDVSAAKGIRRNAKVTADTVCAGCLVSRESMNGELDEWIMCSGCNSWLHIDCAGFKNAHEVRDVDKYFCTGCEAKDSKNKTTYVRKSTRAHAAVDYAGLNLGVLKTSDDNHEHHYIQPIKDGTFTFEEEKFPRMRPELVTQEFFERSGAFVEPICIPAAWNPRPCAKRRKLKEEAIIFVNTVEGTVETMAGEEDLEMADADEWLTEDLEYESVPDEGQDKLDMVMPQDLTVRQVCELVGPEYPLEVIDVKIQGSAGKWNLKRWADYYEKEGEKPIQNVISLEVSATKLGRLLRRPKIVRQIDLQDQVWPREEREKGKWPNVQFYCLMSIADSYTDFHIDFGGSSVYYHILKGKKTFFFIPPKAKHLKAYEEWNESPQQNFTFLPSITKECYRVDLSEGDTMLIPSGWIHAVWTPETSLVIGGNFLTRMHYLTQFRVVDIEKNNATPQKFRYPHFQKIMWYTTLQYLEKDPLPPAVAQGFYEGRRFERQKPIYEDFDGTIADCDPRQGAQNARYYSKHEVEGLPELVNFIFRTVMIVMGRIEGMSDDKRKRVNASIPKSHGEPLEIAKTFALWVAWKRGNEDPPAWAHPDAVLPNSKEDGKPKKLSAKALKDLQRQEAIAAWKIVGPDRQSARQATKAAVASSHATATASPAPAPAPAHVPTPMPAAIPAMLMNALPGQHVSTPKTSVLGPKRIACDACRKRRIRCKHKDVVMTAPDSNIHGQTPTPMPNDLSYGSSQNGSQYEFDNITVTPPHQRQSNFLATVMDGAQDPNRPNATPYHLAGANGAMQGVQSGPLPGTNAYINANVPMTMNGVPLFGDAAKRGRSKACYECRKSKVGIYMHAYV